jgi:secreted trypsin-like serine protease
MPDASEEIYGEETQSIVGGTATQIGTVPWQVSLQDGNGHFCGGSIVTPTWIVTAAHCMGGGAPTRIVAGMSRLSQANVGQIRSIARIITYPGYTDASQGKDAALIELTAPLQLNGTTVKAIKPLNAGSATDLTAPGVMATVSGWGLTVEGGTALSDQLLSVQVPIQPLSAANTAYNMTITEDQLAAGTATGGKDSCQGDSGGPLVVTANGEPALAGIVSWGDGCGRANVPGLYARITSFARWMDTYAGGPPTAAAGDDLSVKPGTRVQVDGGASADTGFGMIASYTWRQVSGAPVTLEGANTKTASFNAPSATGTVELELTVADEGGNSATDRVLVTISQNGGTGTGEGGGTGTGEGGGGELGDDVYGGCTSHRGTGPLVLFLALGFVVRRRRR